MSTQCRFPMIHNSDFLFCVTSYRLSYVSEEDSPWTPYSENGDPKVLMGTVRYSDTKARLYGEKLSRVKGSPSYPSYPGRTNFSYISLQNFTNRLYEKQKVGSARRVTRLAGSPSFDGRVTLLAGPTDLHINTLTRPAESTRLRRDD